MSKLKRSLTSPSTGLRAEAVRTRVGRLPDAPPIRLFLVDDHPVVREGLRSFLGADSRFKIVGEAVSGEEALSLVLRARPHLVLMDINLPGMSGLEAAARLRRRAAWTKVLILSMHDRGEYVAQVARSGARGFVLKDASPGELVRAIEMVHSGQTWFSPQIAATMFKELTPADRVELSRREREVLAAIAEGASSKTIARRFAVSLSTVRTYRDRLRRKLDLHSIAAFTEFALRNGLIDPRRAAKKRF